SLYERASAPESARRHVALCPLLGDGAGHRVDCMMSTSRQAPPFFRMEGIRMQFRSEGASKGFAASVVTALNGVSFDLADDEVVGLVGESGSGKSTIGQILLKLIRPTAGQVSFKGKALGDMSPTENNEY